MSYYVTMRQDNIEEVVSVYLLDDVTTVAKHTIDAYGQIEFNRNENGTYEGRLVDDENIVFRIVKS